MPFEPDTPNVRNLVTIGVVSTFATIAICYLVVGMTFTERQALADLRKPESAATQAPVLSDESKQAVLDKYAD